MKLNLSIIISLIFVCQTFGQKKYFEHKFEHYTIVKNNDTIHFHTYSNGDMTPKKGILLYSQGSGSDPFYKLIRHIDTVKTSKNEEPKINKYLEVHKTLPFNLEAFTTDYLLVAISKKSIPFEIFGNDFKTPKAFYENDNLNYRVWQANEVVNYLSNNRLQNKGKIIALGHSEGTEVVAKLGTINNKITAIGYFSGSGNAQYYDFILDIRKYVQRGEMTEEESIIETEKVFNEVKDIYKDPNSLTKKWIGHSYRKWSTSVEPSIDNLLKINIPIYVAHGAKDKAVPIESAYLIPIEFIRHQKTNLTFKVYPKLDHSFAILPKSDNEVYEEHWDDVFNDFLKWCEINY
ncbi:dienelactone hydrolase family protein [Olleya sp. HaHaR_3_96]|uniref:alpha/beta hydrolase n=1 Tax=Olleya sp. HaHaR_3_96 TaxID=2745560 RepID=UPI001C4FFE17|nr:dienelactone hydrolase family protein [Olleya sp. HaHaR_3_96]QXP58993.1 dienelactone hydrolase family protein [Olleya sp. HaHaR_3_96]